jgi:tRNA-Thr(GGU) m(6)t(6)A37 methyltransferase TsaA
MEHEQITLRPIGYAGRDKDGPIIAISEPFRSGLTGLDGYSHLMVIWYANQADADEAAGLILQKPYSRGPERIGVFATRSPERPNRVAVSIIPVTAIDYSSGVIQTPYIDAEEGTPIIDIKPYLPCTERIRDVRTPDWASHWPAWYEDNATFDWGAEFS